jgi:hypothetical protein
MEILTSKLLFSQQIFKSILLEHSYDDRHFLCCLVWARIIYDYPWSKKSHFVS